MVIISLTAREPNGLKQDTQKYEYLTRHVVITELLVLF